MITPDRQVEELMEEVERKGRTSPIGERREETVYLVIIYGAIVLAAWLLATR